MNWILLALLPIEVPLTDRVDMIEHNRLHDEQGAETNQQWLFWDWIWDDWSVADWRWRKGSNPPHRTPSGWRLVLWDEGALRVINSKVLHKTWTQYDPELAQRKLFPQESRRGLRKRYERSWQRIEHVPYDLERFTRVPLMDVGAGDRQGRVPQVSLDVVEADLPALGQHTGVGVSKAVTVQPLGNGGFTSQARQQLANVTGGDPPAFVGWKEWVGRLQAFLGSARKPAPQGLFGALIQRHRAHFSALAEADANPALIKIDVGQSEGQPLGAP